MTQQPEPSLVQEPGIGGPVDLTGIERYRKVRIGAIFVLMAAMIALVIASAEGAGWAYWPEAFPLRRWLPIGILAMQGYVCAVLALNISAGNRTENRLVLLAAALAAGLGVLVTSGCAALLFVLDPGSPPGWRIVLPVVAGYAAVLPVTLPATIMAERRRKRLVRAAEAPCEAGEATAGPRA